MTPRQPGGRLHRLSRLVRRQSDTFLNLVKCFIVGSEYVQSSQDIDDLYIQTSPRREFFRQFIERQIALKRATCESEIQAREIGSGLRALHAVPLKSH